MFSTPACWGSSNTARWLQGWQQVFLTKLPRSMNPEHMSQMSQALLARELALRAFEAASMKRQS